MKKQTTAAKTASPLKPTRGHKKKARTREQLLRAAWRIYGRKSAAELALNELAEDAGVSSGTVYNYFRTREDVMEAVGLELAGVFSTQIAAITQGVLPAERLCVAVRMFIRRAQQEPDWGRALVNLAPHSEVMRSTLTTYLRTDLRAGEASGDFRHANEEVAVTFVLSAALGAVKASVDGAAIAAQDSLVAEMILLALGMSTQKAKRLAVRPLPDIGEPSNET